MEQTGEDRPNLVVTFAKIILLLAVPIVLFRLPVRFSSEVTNSLFGWFLAMVCPWGAVVLLFRLRRRWAKIFGGVLVLPLLIYSMALPFSVLLVGFVGSERFAESDWNGSKVRLYQTNGGAMTSYGIRIEQERTIFPGVILFRHLDNFYPCYGLNLTSSLQGVTVRNKGYYCPDFGEDQRSYKLKRFIYF